MPRTLVLSIPGLSRALLPHVPPASTLGTFIARSAVGDLIPTWPAVTCSVQASLTTGVPPSQHGIVANGLPTYRDGADLTDPANLTDFRRKVSFWEQSNVLLEAPRFWHAAGDVGGWGAGKTALLFFQNSMPGFGPVQRPSADIVLTPKPQHGPDGRLTSLLWSNSAGLAESLQADLGPFPLMNYWGPMANILSSRWITRAATRVWTVERPALQLTYVPHLDYDLQRFGPGSIQAERAVADVAEVIEPLLLAAGGHRVVILSEYAITPVERAIAPNLALREAGHLQLRPTPEGTGIDYAASDAWVMCDHQIGHVYTRGNADVADIRAVLTGIGLEVVLPRPVSHLRAGDTQVQAPLDAWLDYRWWSDLADAPAWASTVDIHRKPGYDPLELFIDPITGKISDDVSRVKGSHGRVDGPCGVIISREAPPTLIADRFASWLKDTSPICV